MALSSPGRLLRLLVTASLTALVLWKSNPAAVLAVLSRTDVRWIATALALVVVDRTLMAYRSLVLLRPIDPALRPSFAAAMRVFFVSTFLGTFLPASIGGDIVRAYSLAQLQVPTAAAVASVVMDRMLGVLSIVLVGAAGLVLAADGDLVSSGAIVAAFAVATAACTVTALVVFSESAAAFASGIAARLPFSPVRGLSAGLTQATRAYAQHHGALFNVLCGSVAVQVLRILQAYCLGRALGLAAPLAVYFAFVPLILLVILLPVSINGIGTSQAAFVLFFARASVPYADAFALSVLFIALGVVGNLPGGLLYALGPKKSRT